MKPSPSEDLPELLRERILRQRKRLKLVRVTFALTIVATIGLMVAAHQSQSMAPTARIMFVMPQAEDLWLLDQHLEPSQQGTAGGSFAMLQVRGDEVQTGPRYEGVARSVTVMDDKRVGVTTSTRFMQFEHTEAGWQRGEFQSLGLNDPTASPAVVSLKGELWLCWSRGVDVMVQPLGRPDVAARSLYQTKSPDAVLLARVSGDVIWLACLETRNGELSIVAFKPGIETSAPAEKRDNDTDAVPDAADVQSGTVVQRVFSAHVAEGVLRCTFAVLETPQGAQPVIAFTRKDDDKRIWHLRVWLRDDATPPGKWVDASAPDREKPPSSLDLSNFLTLAARGPDLLAVYNDGQEVRITQAAVAADGALTWSPPTVLAVDGTRAPYVYVLWVVLLFVALLVMASQMVWLMLNRERAMDRALAELLEKREGINAPKKNKDKDKPRLLYANALSRVIALLIDIALTSPLIILLQGVYSYKLEQAYGFLAVGAFETMNADIVLTLQATAVTLIVLSMYAMICELAWGRTLGKALLRLRVVDAKGEAPAAWRIVVRNFLRVFELIHWFILMIPMGVMLLSGKGQRLGDLLGGTYVVVDAVPEESPDDIDI